MMQFTAGEYLITSHGNGWAYEVKDQTTGQSFWAQDDDAAQLQKDTNDFKCLDILGEYFTAFCEE